MLYNVRIFPLLSENLKSAAFVPILFMAHSFASFSYEILFSGLMYSDEESLSAYIPYKSSFRRGEFGSYKYL